MNTARAVPVLMYHHVSPSPGLVTIAPENFRAQMAWLARNGWRTIGLDALARFIHGEPLPAKSMVITFDDGYLDNWVHAHPVMAEHGLHGVIFLITGWIGEGPVRPHAGLGDAPPTPAHKACMDAVRSGRNDDVMLRWSEVLAMREAGTFEFHSHTHTHTRWDQIETDPAVREAKLAHDLERSRHALREHLGAASTHLCWPQGYYDAGYQRQAQANGFTHLYTVAPGTCTAMTPAQAIPRIVVKDRGAGWLGRRLWLYHRPTLARAYLAVRGKGAA